MRRRFLVGRYGIPPGIMTDIAGAYEHWMMYREKGGRLEFEDWIVRKPDDDRSYGSVSTGDETDLSDLE